jgi:hypothetical protein
MKAKVSYGHCSLYVFGMEMNCPMCGVLVKSGEQHSCSSERRQIDPLAKKPKPKARKTK